MLLRKLAYQCFEVGDERQLFLISLRLGAVEQSFRQNHLEKVFLVDDVVRAGDDAERGDHVAHYGILSQRSLVGQAARDPCGEKSGFRVVSDIVLSIQEGVLPPRQSMLGPIPPNVPDDPRDLGILGRKRQRRHFEIRCALRLGVPPVCEDRSVDRDEPAREVHHLSRTAPVLPELRAPAIREVTVEVAEDLGVGARPGVDGLLVVTYGEDVSVLERQRADDLVLRWIEVLKLVDKYGGPFLPHLRRDGFVGEQLRGLEHEHVEIQLVALRQKLLIALVEREIVRLEGIAPKTVSGERRQHAWVPPAISLEPAQHPELVLVVGNAEARLDTDVRAQLAQQLHAERVDGSTLHAFHSRAEGLEPAGDLVGRLVGERKDPDALRLDLKMLDEKAHALDEAESLAGARAGENQDRPHRGFNCLTL